jgi:hypothetical protein
MTKNIRQREDIFVHLPYLFNILAIVGVLGFFLMAFAIWNIDIGLMIADVSGIYR